MEKPITFTYLISYPPKVPISKLVNSLKGVSSRLLRKEFPELQDRFYQGVLWSPSYFAGSCGGATLSVVKQHIEQQRTINLIFVLPLIFLSYEEVSKAKIWINSEFVF